ncbi:SusC/RagA family TonB-linked outer membrane protein [Chitinophaga sp. SYP-B3965]|uniref:SusC/RagA family TonB-linked outer membrane protein n=1 Tax=Chitinophaga sp. SYP-B3965 TaxID=2663120 RepID=UPI0012998FE8|nr:TonB-dependent receptor [Chitinophaga sp. SYP-B3965]MRG44979.1 SusC/RagA family TonB-linked outer membrane protein [Chitinophaga sp. SYP-B3965]
MKKILRSIFLLSMLLLTYESWAQNKPVTGKVTDDLGLPIPGVSIYARITKGGTITNTKGEFSISVSPDEKFLTVTALTFADQEVPITGAPLQIKLQSESKSLSEVVVVGYGTQKVTKVSGAISTIKGADIEKLRPTRVEEALQGRAAGVSVIQNGSPGSKPTVLIRGIPSFVGTDPIVIVDGVPQTLDDLNAIPSTDIESINVLKDAATTAIYGVKGGNGVIVVTTKGGRKNQRPEITLNANYGIQEVQNTIGVLNASEYGAIINEGSVAAGGNIIFPDLSKLGVGTNWQKEIFHQAPIQSYNVGARGGSDKISYFVSGGYLGQDGIVGGGSKSNFNRTNATGNFTIDLTPRLKFIVNTSYVNIRAQGVQENSFNAIIGSALNYDPTVTVLNTVPNTVGRYGYSNLLLSEIFNPLTKLDNTYNESNGAKLYGKGELQYEIMKGLRVTSRFGYTTWNVTGKNFTPLIFHGPMNVENTMNADGSTVATKNGLGQIASSAHNSVNEYKNSAYSWTSESFANYDFKIREAHTFDVVAGISFSKLGGNAVNASRQDVPFNSWEFADVTAATGTNSTAVVYFRDTVINGVAMQVRDPKGDVAANLNAQGGGNSQYFRRNASYFGRINYDYKEKYLASFTARRDGSYAFGPNNKFANFFSGSLGWVASSEPFFKSNFISYLKIRGSYGTVGNENVSPQFPSIETGGPQYSNANNNGYTFGGTFVAGSTLATSKNESLGWEKQTQFNIGFDISFFQDKLSLTADYFDKQISGLLFLPSPSDYGGTAAIPNANIGSTKSSGIDATLGYNDRIAKDVTINTSLTFTTSENMVTGTNTDNSAIITGGGYFNGQSNNVTRFQKGFTPGYFYGFKTAGLFQTAKDVADWPRQTGAQPGDIRFVDVNKDSIISDLDRTQIGNPFPDFTLGWNLGLTYKNFDFNVFTYISIGNDVYSAYERNANYTNKFNGILDRWTGPNTTNDAKNPRYSFTDANNNIRVSERYVEDGSFAKIKNIQLGYTLPNYLLRNAGFRSVRVYVQAKNLYTFTNYSGYDPEIPGGILDTGIDRGNYPQARTWAFGIDIKL